MQGLFEQFALTDFRLLNAFIVFVAFAIAAKLLDIIITKVLKRVARKTTSTFDDKLIDALHQPVFILLIIIGALEALEYLGPSEKVFFFLERSLKTLIVVTLAVAAVRLSNRLTEKALFKVADITGLGKDVIPFVENVWRAAIILAGILSVFHIWRINITPLLASAGIAGVIIALAAKDSIANFFGGISIFIDRPYKVGDYIVLDSGERGEVVEIGMRSTRIKTRDDILITVPNSIIASTKITNESAPEPKFRIRVPIGVAYGSDIDLVEAVLMEISLGNPNVIDDPQPRVRFRSFGDSSLNYELLCWAKDPSLRGLTVHEINCAIYKNFAEKGIKIPFPQRDLHIHGDMKSGTNG